MAIKDHGGNNTRDRMDYILSPVDFDNSTIGFFDGVVARGICGVGLFLKLNIDHLY
jgi:hypothetical protein